MKNRGTAGVLPESRVPISPRTGRCKLSFEIRGHSKIFRKKITQNSQVMPGRKGKIAVVF